MPSFIIRVDLDQGNVSRKLLKGGLLGLGHIMKGRQILVIQYMNIKYIDSYARSSEIKHFLLDVKIILRGIVVILKGVGINSYLKSRLFNNKLALHFS